MKRKKKYSRKCNNCGEIVYHTTRWGRNQYLNAKGCRKCYNGAFKDIMGQKFTCGNIVLEVIGREPNVNGMTKWKVRCESCGEIGVKYRNALINKESRCLSCDGRKYEFQDLTGKKFGRLTIIERVENNSQGTSQWKCECDCGNIVIRVINKKDNMSCGCAWTDFMKNNHPMQNPETKKKWRKTRIKNLQKQLEKNGQTLPRYNPSSIPILEKKARELDITDLQHQENGGEFYIKELAYYVDGYSKEKNIVLEYYEQFHKWGKYPKKDKLRKDEIINHLGCEFYEIWYDDIQ
jgi:hypothetical protein